LAATSADVKGSTVNVVEEMRVADGTLRGKWVELVFRSPLITDAARVALLAMAVDMDDAGRVSVKREDLARRIGKGKARITERLNAAVDAGLLERELEGKRGQVAVYAARFPQGSGYADPNIRSGELSMGPDTRTHTDSSDAEQGPDKRTESERFGSGLQTQTSADSGEQGPDTRTPTAGYGSAQPDPLCSSGVREGEDLQVVEGEGLFEIESAASQQLPSKRKKRASTSKTVVPADYAPTEELRAWARERCPLVDIDLQTERFIIHFTDKGIKRPGWDRSWKSWMLQQQDWTKQRQERQDQGNVHPLPSNRYAPGSGSQVPPRSDYRKEGYV
jgi:hypothetical protein